MKCSQFQWLCREPLIFICLNCIFETFICPKRNSNMDGLLMLFVLSVLRCFGKIFIHTEHEAIQFDCCDLFYCSRIVKQKFSICIAYEANDPKISNYCNVSIFSTQIPSIPCSVRTRRRPITIHREMQTLLINIDDFNYAIHISNG